MGVLNYIEELGNYIEIMRNSNEWYLDNNINYKVIIIINNYIFN